MCVCNFCGSSVQVLCPNLKRNVEAHIKLMLKRSAANVRLNPEYHLKKSRAKKRCIEKHSENDRNSSASKKARKTMTGSKNKVLLSKILSRPGAKRPARCQVGSLGFGDDNDDELVHQPCDDECLTRNSGFKHKRGKKKKNIYPKLKLKRV